MNARNMPRIFLTACIAAACFAISASADAAAMQPLHQGNVTFITGGIGDAEQQEMRDAAKNYNLQISSANASGHFMSGTNFRIAGKDGHEILKIAGTGPLFFVNLPAGDYTIHASYGVQSTDRKISISDGKTADVHLVWK